MLTLQVLTAVSGVILNAPNSAAERLCPTTRIQEGHTMRTKHTIARGATAIIIALSALIATAASALSTAERTPAPTSIDFQAITDAANRNPLVFN